MLTCLGGYNYIYPVLDLSEYSYITDKYLLPILAVLFALDRLTTYIGLRFLPGIVEVNPVVVQGIELMGLELTVIVITIPPIFGIILYHFLTQDRTFPKTSEAQLIANTTITLVVFYYLYVVVNNILVITTTLYMLYIL